MMGQPVYNGVIEANGMVNIPVASLAQGVYIVTIQNGDQVVTERLMKE
jgi:hypothetical protein